MKTWLKGGLIGLVIGIIFILISLFGAAATCVVGGIQPPICNIFRKICASPYNILFPLVGIIIGFIISKIKRKKK